jgi:hypothetical protein
MLFAIQSAGGAAGENSKVMKTNGIAFRVVPPAKHPDNL